MFYAKSEMFKEPERFLAFLTEVSYDMIWFDFLL